MTCCIGTAHSKQLDRVDSKLVTSYGSLKVVWMPPTTALIVGLSNIPTRFVYLFSKVSYQIALLKTFIYPTQTAIIYEADEPGEGREITFSELLREVSSVANVLKALGVKKGDTVSVYLPMTWQAVATFLACARIGAVHSVVFAGFSAESLRDRIQDCKCRVVITSDEGKRGGKTIANKAIVDAALKECPLVEHVLVLQRTGNKVAWTEGRDKWWHEEILKVPNYCAPEVMSSEDPLFILYVRPLLIPIYCLKINSNIYLSRPLDLLENPRVSFIPQEDIFYVLH